jgi:hypothetical protein
MVISKPRRFAVQSDNGVSPVLAESCARVMHDRFIVIRNAKAINLVGAVLVKGEQQV